MNSFVLVFPENSRLPAASVRSMLHNTLQSVSVACCLSDLARVYYFKKNLISFTSFLDSIEESRLVRKRFSGFAEANRFKSDSNTCFVLGQPLERNHPIAKVAHRVKTHPNDIYLSILPNQYTGRSSITVTIGTDILLYRTDEDLRSTLKGLFEHRSPKRVFERSLKHERAPKWFRGHIISPFEYDDEQGQILLNQSIKIGEGHLLARHSNHGQVEYIHFRSHLLNKYHGYQTPEKPQISRECDILLDLIDNVK